MSDRLLVVLACVGVACGDESESMGPVETSELSLVSYRELREVEHIEAIAAGYAVLGRHGLAAYDQDDRTQWEVELPGAPLALGLTAEGDALRMATEGEGVVWLDRIDLGGALGEPVELSDPEGPLDMPTVVLREDGGAWVHGGQWPFFWQGRVLPDGTLEVERPEAEERRALLPAQANGAYALRATWTTDTGIPEQVDLQRLAADGTAQWTVMVHDGTHDATGAFELGGTLGPDGRGGVYVVTLRSNMSAPAKAVVRRYDAEGTLLSNEVELHTPQSSLRSLARPGGGSVWLEGVAGTRINVRLVDLGGEISDKASFEGDGTPIMDATFIGNILHVLTHDGLTRIYVPPLVRPVM
ncbi:MAG: hypothetical protein AAGF11_02015 [Myxococcota bacterium]